VNLNIQNATIHLTQGMFDGMLLGAALAKTGSATTPSSAGRDDGNDPIVPPALGEYWAGQGGFYAGTWPAMPHLKLQARHLVFSEEETKLAYGSHGEDEPTAASRVDGRANTAALLDGPFDHPAAQWAADFRKDGHTDFHLPSQADLFLAALMAPHRFEKDGWYLSSTQYSRGGAFVQDFEYGLSTWNSKDAEFRVRAVRWIHFNA
jgi:hypothetical protein